MMQTIDLPELLDCDWPLIDVRSPQEYLDDHIPGALNVPLLNNQHRHEVGLCYKQEGKAAAIALGHQLISPLEPMLLDQIKSCAPNNQLRLYCARGGLRSHKMAEFLSQNGFEVKLVKGGYKRYRQEVLSTIAQFTQILILSGYTGSGKTQVLQAIKAKGAQVLDLEALAHHKGSAFGHLGMPIQNSSAQFHNDIYEVLKTLDPNKILWVENESFIIGKVHMPAPLWQNMQTAKVIAYQIPVEERVKLIIEAYGQFPKSQLMERVVKLSKRLGHEMAQQICEYIAADQLEKAVPPLLKYYDKAYTMGRVKRAQAPYMQVDFDHFDANAIAEQLLNMG